MKFLIFIISLSIFHWGAEVGASIQANYYSCENGDHKVLYTQEWELSTDGSLVEVPVLRISIKDLYVMLKGKPFMDGDIEMIWTGNGYLIRSLGAYLDRFELNAPNIYLNSATEFQDIETMFRDGSLFIAVKCKVEYHY